ncbi:MAG: radical SAM family heme chaperone HemW [Caloramator sp.]|nr:radical SAM family heme chaperone HemW [Caloramator sp.]
MERALYIHIPFCVRKCLYCDFYSLSDLSLQDNYIDAVITEIKRIDDKKFKSVFIGGGTPTVLSNKNLEKLLKSLSKFQYLEFTVEANPGTLEKEKLILLKEYGVNRLSIGLQAVQDRILKKLGRIHSFNDFLENYEMARRVGFNNINVDLMFDIPGQGMDEWKETLDKIAEVNPEHLSCYSLIIEEGTPFYELYNSGQLNIADENMDREMYHYAVAFLKSKGFIHYEISNFALPGYECIHNLTYWDEEEYYGVGASAHSFIDKCRYYNVDDVKEYIKLIYNDEAKKEKIFISKKDEMSEFMILGLRKIKGVSKGLFKKRFNEDVYDVFGQEISKLIEQGLLKDDGENVFLTRRGLDVANQVFVKFIL